MPPALQLPRSPRVPTIRFSFMGELGWAKLICCMQLEMPVFNADSMFYMYLQKNLPMI
jgi:hypothetical protein